MPDGFGSIAEQIEYAKALREVYRAQLQELTQQYVDGAISVQDWQIDMRESLREMNAAMLVVAANVDPANVTSSDWLKLGNELRSQYDYLEDFAHQTLEDPTVLGSAVQRAGLYANSTISSFWRQLAPVDLPAYPGDGSTRCITNCNCDWQFDNEYDDEGNIVAVLATWVLEPGSNTCEDCLERSQKWVKLRVNVDDKEHRTKAVQVLPRAA